MDRYEEVTQRIQKSMKRDRLTAPLAALALALGLFGLVGTYVSLGSTVKWSKIACFVNPHTVACRGS